MCTGHLGECLVRATYGCRAIRISKVEILTSIVNILVIFGVDF